MFVSTDGVGFHQTEEEEEEEVGFDAAWYSQPSQHFLHKGPSLDVHFSLLALSHDGPLHCFNFLFFLFFFFPIEEVRARTRGTGSPGEGGGEGGGGGGGGEKVSTREEEEEEAAGFDAPARTSAAILAVSCSWYLMPLCLLFPSQPSQHLWHKGPRPCKRPSLDVHFSLLVLLSHDWPLH